MTSTTTVSLSAIISTARREKGLSQEQVAGYLKMKRATYAKKETDEGFTEGQLRELAKLFKLKATDLIQAKNNKEFTKVDAFIIIDDLQKHLVQNSLLTDAYLRTFSYYLASLVAISEKRKVDEVKAEMLAMVNAELKAKAKQ